LAKLLPVVCLAQENAEKHSEIKIPIENNSHYKSLCVIPEQLVLTLEKNLYFIFLSGKEEALPFYGKA